MNLDAPRLGWIVALAASAIGTAWHQYAQIEALNRENGVHAAESADLRIWRMSVEQALRNCKP